MVCIRITNGEGVEGKEGVKGSAFQAMAQNICLYFNTYNNYGQGGIILLLNIQQTTELSIHSSPGLWIVIYMIWVILRLQLEEASSVWVLIMFRKVAEK